MSTSFSRFPGMADSALMDLLPEEDEPSLLSDFVLFDPPFVVNGMLSDFSPFVCPAIVTAVLVASGAFGSLPGYFGLLFLKGGSSMISVVVAFLFFFVIPESIFLLLLIGVSGPLVGLEIEEVVLRSVFSALLAVAFEVVAGDEAPRCLILEDDD